MMALEWNYETGFLFFWAINFFFNMSIFWALCANEIKQKLESIFMLASELCFEMQLTGKNLKPTGIFTSSRTHTRVPSALEEHEKHPSLFEVIYFNMKDIHGHSFPPLTVKGHRNNEVLRAQLTSAAAAVPTVCRDSVTGGTNTDWQSKVTTAILSRANRDEWYVRQRSVCLSVSLQESNHLSLCRQPCKRLTIKLKCPTTQKKKKEKPQAPDQTLQSFCKSSIKLEP